MQSIVFMGTPDFSVVVLQGLLKAGYDIKAVVTQPDKPVGRRKKLTPSPLKIFAETQNLTILQPAKLSGSLEAETIKKIAPDFIITAAFGQFLPMSVLNAAKIAAVNVHGSLLPKYRGGSPIQTAIMNGDSKTGITIMYMAKKMDAGDILSQASIPIDAKDTSGSLFEKLSYLGRDLLLKTLPKIVNGQVTPQKQDDQKVTFAYNLKPEQEILDFTKNAITLDRQIRGLNPDPGAYTYFQNQRVKIWLGQVVSLTAPKTAGQVAIKTKKQLVIAAGDGTSGLGILELQPAGKHKMPIAAFLNGIGQKITVGEQLIND